MVTPCRATLRARPAMNPVSPLRAPFDSPSCSIGDFTDDDVMLTIRPNLRPIMPSIVALISSIGREHVRVDRAHPGVAIPFAEVSRRRPSGVVDQDVRLRAGGERGALAPAAS